MICRICRSLQTDTTARNRTRENFRLKPSRAAANRRTGSPSYKIRRTDFQSVARRIDGLEVRPTLSVLRCLLRRSCLTDSTTAVVTSCGSQSCLSRVGGQATSRRNSWRSLRGRVLFTFFQNAVVNRRDSGRHRRLRIPFPIFCVATLAETVPADFVVH